MIGTRQHTFFLHTFLISYYNIIKILLEELIIPYN